MSSLLAPVASHGKPIGRSVARVRHAEVRDEAIRAGQNVKDIAARIVGFMQQFLEVFAELKGKKFYVSGESVSCIIAASFMSLG